MIFSQSIECAISKNIYLLQRANIHWARLHPSDKAITICDPYAQDSTIQFLNNHGQKVLCSNSLITSHPLLHMI